MDRVYDSGVSATPTDLPAAPETGYPIAGDPLTATPATKPGAYWFYMITESLRTLIVSAGLTPDHEDLTLVSDAIDAKIAAAIAGTDLLPPGHISGLTLSNGTDATNDINIATGKAKSSSADFDIDCTVAIGKQIDAAWAAGGTTATPTGGFPTGITLTNNTWYRVFLISKPDGTVGAGFDTSSTAANLLADATGYTKYRHVGWIRRGVGTNLAFIQAGSQFDFVTPVSDYSSATLASTTESKTLTVPQSCIANISVSCRRGSSTGTTYYRLYQAAMTSAAASASNFDFVSGIDIGGNLWEYSGIGRISVKADASSQIKISASTTGGDAGYSVVTHGWTDPDIN